MFLAKENANNGFSHFVMIGWDTVMFLPSSKEMQAVAALSCAMGPDALLVTELLTYLDFGWSDIEEDLRQIMADDEDDEDGWSNEKELFTN